MAVRTLFSLKDVTECNWDLSDVGQEALVHLMKCVLMCTYFGTGVPILKITLRAPISQEVNTVVTPNKGTCT